MERGGWTVGSSPMLWDARRVPGPEEDGPMLTPLSSGRSRGTNGRGSSWVAGRDCGVTASLTLEKTEGYAEEMMLMGSATYEPLREGACEGNEDNEEVASFDNRLVAWLALLVGD